VRLRGTQEPEALFRDLEESLVDDRLGLDLRRALLSAPLSTATAATAATAATTPSTLMAMTAMVPVPVMAMATATSTTATLRTTVAVVAAVSGVPDAVASTIPHVTRVS
jgi:hypothetical protein